LPGHPMSQDLFGHQWPSSRLGRVNFFGDFVPRQGPSLTVAFAVCSNGGPAWSNPDVDPHCHLERELDPAAD
jgi:hypothetical protein